MTNTRSIAIPKHADTLSQFWSMTMNANFKYLIAVAAMISSVAHASAGDLSSASNTSLMREQVHAEAMRARDTGELDFNDTNYPLMVKEAASTVTRMEVRADLDRARIAGELDINDTNYPILPKLVASTLTRTQVRLETQRASDAGELDFSDTTYPLTVHATRGQ